MKSKRFIFYACAVMVIVILVVIVGFSLGNSKTIKRERPKLTATMQPTKEVFSAVAEKLKAYKGWTVEKYPGSSYSKIFNHIPEMSLPAVIISYHGSSANDEIPWRTLSFSIIIVTKDTGNFETGALKSIELIDQAIVLLDNEKYNTVRFKFRSESPLDLSNSNLSAYVLSFEALDY